MWHLITAVVFITDTAAIISGTGIMIAETIVDAAMLTDGAVNHA